jgi:hypothetical protein
VSADTNSTISAEPAVLPHVHAEMGMGPLLLSLAGSLALLAALWGWTLLRAALAPEHGMLRVPLDPDAKELVVGDAKADVKVVLRDEKAALSMLEKASFGALPIATDAPPNTISLLQDGAPPAYDPSPLAPAPAFVRTTPLAPPLTPVHTTPRALRGFTTSLLPPVGLTISLPSEDGDPPIVHPDPPTPTLLLHFDLPALTLAHYPDSPTTTLAYYPDPPTPTLACYPDPPTPTLPSYTSPALVLPTAPTHAPDGSALLRALLAAADVGDPAWLLRVLVLVLGWAFAAAAPVPVSDSVRQIQTAESERRLAVLV